VLLKKTAEKACGLVTGEQVGLGKHKKTDFAQSEISLYIALYYRMIRLAA